MEKKAQFTLEQLYISPFTARRRYDEDGNVSWVPLERNTEPTGIWVMCDMGTEVHCHTAEQQGYKTKNRNVTRNKGRRDMSKKSIRFYKDHKVRAMWNEDGNH